MDLDEMYGEGWCVTLQGADFRQEHRDEGTFLLAREMPGGWTLTLESESGIGSDDDVLRTLAADGRTAVSAYRDPDTKTATIAHDGAILGQLELSGGHFDGPSGSVDTTHPVIGSLTAVGFDASDDCEPTGEADTEEPEGRLILAVRVLRRH